MIRSDSRGRVRSIGSATTLSFKSLQAEEIDQINSEETVGL
jgi:hypothetical protein